MREDIFGKEGTGPQNEGTETKESDVDDVAESYKRYEEVGGIINKKDYAHALKRARDLTALNKALPDVSFKIIEQRAKQAEFMAKFAGIDPHNTNDALDPRVVLYGILRSDARPEGVEHHHSRMGDIRLFAEALRMLEDTASLAKLKEAHPNIQF